MRRVIFAVLIFCQLGSSAQNNSGIHFENSLSWAQIKAKAKQENKYIFVDGYTTWCLPCREMAVKVFPLEKVGTFFNKNFINSAVQFDVTKKDNAEVRKWYKDAVRLKEEYKVQAFPTYFYFNPDGELVHTTIGAVSADEFLANAENALNPKTQYNTLKKQFDEGRNSSDFLRSLANASMKVRDNVFTPIVLNKYLATQNDLLTPENIKFIVQATTKIADPGFVILKEHGDLVDSVAGKGTSSDLFSGIVFDELVLPYLKVNPSVTHYFGGMKIYGKSDDKIVNWDEVEAMLYATYPQVAEKTLSSAKVQYFTWTKDWKKFSEIAFLHASRFTGKWSNNFINTYADMLFNNCANESCLNNALEWSAKTLQVEDIGSKMYYSFTYSKLLYKTGRKDEAIDLMSTLVAYYKDNNGRYSQQLAKMKKGEKTWNE